MFQKKNNYKLWMLKQLERYSCSLNDARPPQTQLTVIVFQIRDEKKTRYSSKHQKICSLLVKAGIQEKSSSLSWIPDYRIALDSRKFSSLKQLKKKKKYWQNNLPTTLPQASIKPLKPCFCWRHYLLMLNQPGDNRICTYALLLFKTF